MSAYYNEIDPFCAQWLRNLITDGHIASGDVDERSICDVQPNDLIGYEQCHFFAGIGVWSHALRQAGWADDKEIWTGSCPCQPFSVAGKSKGIEDERHLWPEMFRLVDERKPAIVVGEQVASKDGLEWLDLVQTDLEESGYAFGAADLCAAGFGAAHIRQRLYWLGSNSCDIGISGQGNAKGASKIRQRRKNSPLDLQQVFGNPFVDGGNWPKPILRKGIDEFANWVGRIRAYGNALHGETATNFIEAVMECVP